MKKFHKTIKMLGNGKFVLELMQTLEGAYYVRYNDETSMLIKDLNKAMEVFKAKLKELEK